MHIKLIDIQKEVLKNIMYHLNKLIKIYKKQKNLKKRPNA